MTTNFDNIVSGISRIGLFTYPYFRSLNGISRPHKGIDISAPAGAAVYSPPLSGVIVNDPSIAQNTPGGFGNYIVVRTLLAGNIPVYTVYGHLKDIGINPVTGKPYAQGDTVAASSQIGEVGNSGINAQSGVYPVHLHYEERIGTPANLTDWYHAMPINPNANLFGLTNGPQAPHTISQGTGGKSAPFFIGPNEPYVSILDLTTGTTTLYYGKIAASFTVTLQGEQQWEQLSPDGTSTIYTRNLIDGVAGMYTDWTEQQSANGDLYQTVGYVKSTPSTLYLKPGTASSNPFLDSKQESKGSASHLISQNHATSPTH